MHYQNLWKEGGYLDWTYRTVERSLSATATATRQYYRTTILGIVFLSLPLMHALGHIIFPHHCHAVTEGVSYVTDGLGSPLDVFTWMAEPGRPCARFGHLCVWTNVFFAGLVPILWIRRLFLEVVFVTLVGLASTIYHALQIHPSWGPFHSWTQIACVSDTVLAMTFGLLLALRYPRTRKRALPAMGGAMVCFLAPGLMPAELAEVGYSWLHSAWHGFSALAAYKIVGNSLAQANGPKTLGGRLADGVLRDHGLAKFLLRTGGRLGLRR